MNATKKLNSKLDTRVILYIIALVLSVLLIVVLIFFSMTMMVLCAMDNPYTYGSCLAQFLGISATVAIILLTACIVARKYPFISGAVMIAIGMVPVVLTLVNPYASYLLILSIPFFVLGLLFLSMGCFNQATKRKAAISDPLVHG